MLDFEYPYTDFGSINLNFILALCKETLGIHLDIDDHTLSLLNFEGTTISSVELPTEAIGDIAEMAKKDVNGKNLTSYAASLTYDSDTNTLTLKSGANNTLAEIELNNGGGTDVVANPTGASTADLTKIKIGNVIYAIPTADLTNYYTKTQVDSKLSAKANSSDLAAVATSGSYNDLSNTPSIPAAQVQSDWNQSDNTKKDYIKNKPSIPAAQVQSNWNESDSSSKAYIQNKPTIPNVPSSSGANDGDVLTHTVSGDAWLPVPKEIPTYTSEDASKVLSVNSSGNNIEWATSGGGGGGVTPPSSIYDASNYTYMAYWSDSNIETGWKPNSAAFSYKPNIDTYSSDWLTWELPSALSAGEEKEMICILPTPNDMSNYVINTPYIWGNEWDTPPVLYRLNGTSISTYVSYVTVSNKTILLGDDIYGNSNPLNTFMTSIQNIAILKTEECWYQELGTNIITKGSIIWATDYTNITLRIFIGKIKNTSSSTIATNTSFKLFGITTSHNARFKDYVWSSYTPA